MDAAASPSTGSRSTARELSRRPRSAASVSERTTPPDFDACAAQRWTCSLTRHREHDVLSNSLDSRGLLEFSGGLKRYGKKAATSRHHHAARVLDLLPKNSKG